LKKKNPIIAILLTLIFAMAPFGAVTNIALGNAVWDEVENLRETNKPLPEANYVRADKDDEDVKFASEKRGGGFGFMTTLPDDPNGNFTGIKWLTKSGGASAATKYRTQVIVRQGESR